MRRPFLILAFGLAFLFPAVAQLTLTGNLRSRMEFRDGYQELLTVAQSPLWIADQRTRLQFDYQDTLARLQVRMMPQEAHVWGSQGAIGTGGKFSMVEGWAAYEPMPGLYVKLGRMFVDYDDQFFMGQRNWGVGLAHDIAMLQLRPRQHPFELHLGYSRSNNLNAMADYAVEGVDYKWLLVSRFQYSFKSSRLAFLWLSDTHTEQDSQADRSRHTLGGIYLWQQPFEGQVALYRQWGRRTDASGTPISAWAWRAQAGKHWGGNFAQAKYTRISGNQGHEPGQEWGQFEMVFGARHRNFGLMDHFRANQSIPEAGLSHWELSLAKSLPSHFSLNLMAHHFALARDVAWVYHELAPGQWEQQLGPVDPALGQELDFFVQFDPSEKVRVKFGYSALRPSATLTRLQLPQSSSPMAQWAWTTWEFFPSFLR